MRLSGSAQLLAQAPLPVQDGVAPSRVYLPPGPWPTVLDFLVERFRFISREVLTQRLEAGEIVNQQGEPVRPGTKFLPHCWLWYYRTVPEEPSIPFEVDVLHQDERLVVVDKPHFLASIPGGRHLRETVLTRLRDRLSLPHLTPVHRLDRDTAGVMLFCCDPSARGHYQQLFQSRDVAKEYEAVAPWRAGLGLPLVYESRLKPGEPHFMMREVAGESNSRTRIELLQQFGTLAHYRLQPTTGRKHQLRVHMHSLGIPICNDAFYPIWRPTEQSDDYTRPLQLLARAVEFLDPFSGQRRRFESQRTLDALIPSRHKHLTFK